MRNLATIQRISNISPIENADAIEVARVLGWNVVIAKKDNFAINDLCCYIEIDSILPDRPEFEFMRDRKFRVRSIRLRGTLSQGLVFPLSILPLGDYEEGTDVTELLGITKFEPYIPPHLAGKTKGTLPVFFPKTDETRVQNLQYVLDVFQGTKCYKSVKYDGTSGSFYLKDGVFGVCSRNMDLIEEETNTYWRTARKLDIENKMRLMSELLNIPDVVVQGEICGPGIQGNRMALKEVELFVFNIYDISNARYLNYSEFISAVYNILELQTVPIIDNYYTLHNDIDKLLEEAKGEYAPGLPREGIVIRPLEEIITRLPLLHASRLSFKAINNDFLLKYKD